MGRYISFLLLLCVSTNAYAQTLIDSIIAVVNTDAITRSELENEFRIAALMQIRTDAAPTTAERRAVLDTIVTRKFVLQEAERRGIVITQRDARVAEKIAEIRAGYAFDGDLQSVLQQYQLEEETVKTRVYEQLIYDEFFRRIFFNDVNTEEVAKLAKSYYDANSTKFIVPPTVTFNSLFIIMPKDKSATEKQAAEHLVQQLSEHLQQGETFKAVYEAYKTRLALWIEELTREVDTPVGTIVTELQISERSAPLPVSEGYQIVERVRNNPARQKPYSEVSEEISERIRRDLAESEFEAWLTERKEEETWHILDDELVQADGETRQTDVE
ncbi:MAG: SurA N-terminal domain-containing protein [Candidatus Poribacteria bacterium]|nr:SurA N-terminal domain-containing protein [Candidatus Poribacteria bacterium]